MINTLECKLRNITFDKFYKRQDSLEYRERYFNTIKLTNRYMKLYSKYFIRRE